MGNGRDPWQGSLCRDHHSEGKRARTVGARSTGALGCDIRGASCELRRRRCSRSYSCDMKAVIELTLCATENSVVHGQHEAVRNLGEIPARPAHVVCYSCGSDIEAGEVQAGARGKAYYCSCEALPPTWSTVLSRRSI